VKPTESRDRGGKMMRAFSQNKALNFPLLFFLVVFIFNLKNLCIMEHKHFVTFNQEHFIGFTCFETTISYHFISKTELSILRIDQSLFGSDDYKETILFKLDHAVKNEISGLKEFLTDLFSYSGNLHGNPWFVESEMISEKEFYKIKKQGGKRMDERKNKNKICDQNHPLIIYCTEQNLYPEPENHSPHSWKAN
jgi:hypothetical protein